MPHPSADPRVVGGVYRSGYWRQTYTVLDRRDGTLTVLWEDGQETVHRTAWDAGRDAVVSVPSSPREVIVARNGSRVPGLTRVTRVTPMTPMTPMTREA